MRLRSVRLLAGLVALLVTVAGCALVTAPVPPNTVPIELEVDNDSVREGTVEVRRSSGPEGRLSSPVAVPPRSTTRVILHVPIHGDWWILVNEAVLIGASDLRGQRGVISNIGIDIDAHGAPSWWCRGVCP
ncbi:MAG TPA: hypothetical protein VLA44_09685 [Clostridia bacterium]|nr:hypothetical protein [Clostridia bacterium]